MTPTKEYEPLPHGYEMRIGDGGTLLVRRNGYVMHIEPDEVNGQIDEARRYIEVMEAARGKIKRKGGE